MSHGVLPAKAKTIGELCIVLNGMLPKPALPNGTIRARHKTGTARSHRQSPRKPRFDQTPAGADIAVMLWHGPDAMHVIWQHNPSIYAKGMFNPSQGDSAAQSVNLIAKQGRSTVHQGDRKEDRCAC
jgi:hypothetical protein